MKSMIDAFITMDTWSFALLAIIIFLVLFFLFFHIRPISSKIAQTTVENFGQMKKNVSVKKSAKPRPVTPKPLKPAVHRNIPSKR